MVNFRTTLQQSSQLIQYLHYRPPYIGITTVPIRVRDLVPINVISDPPWERDDLRVDLCSDLDFLNRAAACQDACQDGVALVAAAESGSSYTTGVACLLIGHCCRDGCTIFGISSMSKSRDYRLVAIGVSKK